MKEHRFQQLWNALAFGRQGHSTLCGQAFSIERPGVFNPGDGPDFRMGALRFADGTLLRGDIELHLHEQQWQEHGHSSDPAYNGVMLHVFLHPAPKPVRLHNGTIPLRCSLLPVISPEQFAGLQQGEGLPCGAGLRYLRPGIVEAQFDKARREYFEKRAEALISWWEPGLDTAQAWKQMVLKGAASVLGLSRNRDAMISLAGFIPGLLREEKMCETALAARLLALSGLDASGAGDAALRRSDWDLSGSRPGNKPKARIRQLAAFAVRLWALRRSDILKSPQACAKQVQDGLPFGRRTELLYLIVWLPAFWLLGSILFSEKLQREAWQLWNTHRYVPEPVFCEPFEAAGFRHLAELSHLGVVHQHRAWCSSKRCGECLIGRTAGLAG